MKNIGNMMKLGIILAAFATAMCVMLALVYTGTKATIDQRQQKDLEAALSELFPNADFFKPIDDISSPDPSVTFEAGRAFAAMQNPDVVAGVALTTSRASYGGPIKTMIGVSADGTITGVKIMEHSDTPGLGANAASPSYFVDREKGVTFYSQFAGKSVNDPFQVKSDVAAITASTVTSRAVALSVKAAALGVHAWINGVAADAVSGASEDASKEASKEGGE